MISQLKAIIFLSARVHLQCGSTLVDDFSSVDIHEYDSATRYFNKMGGDYGQQGLTANYDTLAQHVALTSDLLANENFWFSKFDLDACFDLSAYDAIQFDVIAPVGSSAQFCLTQRSPDCQSRLADSQYMPLSKYINPDGSKQTVTMPIADFGKNVNGGNFDFVHLKDWTLNDLSPKGVTIEISNFRLIRACGGKGTLSVLGNRFSLVSASALSTVAQVTMVAILFAMLL